MELSVGIYSSTVIVEEAEEEFPALSVTL